MVQAWLTDTGTVVQPDQALAVGVGMLIGIITGVILLLLFLQIASLGNTVRDRSTSKIVAECMALPTFWFGGPWLTGKLMASSGLSAAVGYYALTLALMLLLIVGHPLLSLVVRVAEKLKGM